MQLTRQSATTGRGVSRLVVWLIFSVVQRKVLTPNDFASLQAIVDRLDAFERHYNQIAAPFDWTFTRDDLETLVTRVAKYEPRLRLAA